MRRCSWVASTLTAISTGRKKMIMSTVSLEPTAPAFCSARTMYLSLYKMHELALHGFAKVALDTLARLIVRRTEPHVKLH